MVCTRHQGLTPRVVDHSRVQYQSKPCYFDIGSSTSLTWSDNKLESHHSWCIGCVFRAYQACSTEASIDMRTLLCDGQRLVALIAIFSSSIGLHLRFRFGILTIVGIGISFYECRPIVDFLYTRKVVLDELFYYGKYVGSIANHENYKEFVIWMRTWFLL